MHRQQFRAGGQANPKRTVVGAICSALQFQVVEA